MRGTAAVCVVLGLLAPVAARAASCAAPAEGPVLRLSETAVRNVTPTQLVADLAAVASAPTGLAAQRRVNEAMARARALAAAEPAVSATFRDYTTSLVEAAAGKPAHWVASQTLELRGQSGEGVLGLVGRLQASGLVVGELSWRVAREQAEAARRAATLDALAALGKDAAAAAGALGLAVKGYRTIDLSGAEPEPALRRPRAFMAMAAAMPPPQATAAAQEVSASVSAEVVLRPAGPEPGKCP